MNCPKCGAGTHNTTRGLACEKNCGWYREVDNSMAGFPVHIDPRVPRNEIWVVSDHGWEAKITNLAYPSIWRRAWWRIRDAFKPKGTK